MTDAKPPTGEVTPVARMLASYGKTMADVRGPRGDTLTAAARDAVCWVMRQPTVYGVASYGAIGVRVNRHPDAVRSAVGRHERRVREATGG